LSPLELKPDGAVLTGAAATGVVHRGVVITTGIVFVTTGLLAIASFAAIVTGEGGGVALFDLERVTFST
jgi:hypothetical protein